MSVAPSCSNNVSSYRMVGAMEASSVIFAEAIPDTGDNTSFGYIDSTPSTGSTFMDAMFSAMPIIMGVVVVLFIAVVAFIIYAQVRNYRKIKSAGMDPMTLESELKAKLVQSNLLAPKESLEAKLAELSGLLTRGVITNEEYTQARQDLLKAWRQG